MGQWLFSFHGRLGRGRWWAAVLIQILVVLGAALLLAPLVPQDGPPDEDLFRLEPGGGDVEMLAVIVMAIAVIVSVWIGLATSVTRLHDMGRSGWWLVPLYAVGLIGSGIAQLARAPGPQAGNELFGLIGLVVSLLPLIYLGAFPGQPGVNEYGEDPRA